MKILAFSDLHLDTAAADAILMAAGPADLILGAGDFAQRHEGLAGFMARLGPLETRAIHVPGNNETEAALRGATAATVLHGQSVTRDGIVIAGLGGAVPPLPPLPWGSFDLTEDAAETLLARFERADILLVHSPPRDACDLHLSAGHIGSVAIRRAVERLQPRYLLCGHVHDAWGSRARIGATEVINLGPVPTFLEM